VFGGGSFQLARIFGIRIGVDFSWFLILFLIIYWRSQDYEQVVPGSNAFVLAVISALLFFLSILLHELGHAVVAIRNGIPILGIDLWMFGGVAKLGRDSDSAGVEFRIAAAGPLVTLIIAVACFAAGAATEGGTSEMLDNIFLNQEQTATAAVLGHLALVNAALLVFNLIPAFPLDGGRIARAIASGSASFTSATRMCSIRPEKSACTSADRAAPARNTPMNASQAPPTMSPVLIPSATPRPTIA
jgi:Zn-dependent protease